MRFFSIRGLSVLDWGGGWLTLVTLGTSGRRRFGLLAPGLLATGLLAPGLLTPAWFAFGLLALGFMGCENSDSAPQGDANPKAVVKASAAVSAETSGRLAAEVTASPRWDFSADSLQIVMRAVPAVEDDRGDLRSPREPEVQIDAVLPSDDAQALLARLGPMRSPPSATDSLLLSVATSPPPRPGALVPSTLLATSAETHAPPLTPASPGPAEAPRVVRHAPEGPVEIAGGLMVTFSQPMVALTRAAVASREDPSVRLEPEPEGTWRWVGTRTLAFEPVPRFPMATTYHVVVPAGTRAAGGAELAREASWSFTTPPPRLLDQWPGEGPQAPNAPILMVFDQSVRPEDVLAHTRITAEGQVFDARLLKREEACDLVGKTKAPTLGHWMDRHPTERVIALRASEPLPKDATIEVRLTAGLGSAEGPLRTTESQGFTFQTYGPLTVSKRMCTGGTCTPTSHLPIVFNNPLRYEGVNLEEWIRVDPPVEDLQVRAGHDGFYLTGRFSPHTTLRVTVSAKVQDVFGQMLGADVSIEFEVGAYAPYLSWDANRHCVLDPATPVAVPVYTAGYPEIRLTCFAVEPTDWNAYNQWRRDQPLPGRVVHKEVIAVPHREDGCEILLVDLEPAFAKAQGHLIVLLEAGTEDRWRHSRRQAWFQKTDIGLSAHVDGQGLLVWATDLLTGEPIDGAAVYFGDEQDAVSTDATGLARVPLTSSQSYVVAEKGNQRAMLPAQREWEPSGFDGRLYWYVVDDRRLYRPGEQVHMKGWLRLRSAGPTGDVTAVGERVARIRYEVSSAQGEAIASGEVAVDAYGGFALTLDLPGRVSLGGASVTFEAVTDLLLSHAMHKHSFRIEEFRRPEYELWIRPSGASVVQGSKIEVEVDAQYYTGGPLAGAGLTWDLVAGGTQYRPPGHGDFSFGANRFFGFGSGSVAPGARIQRVMRRLAATADSRGRAAVEISVPTGPPLPASVRVAAVVQDLNQQALGADTHFLIHPATEYVGLRREPPNPAWGDSLRLAACVCSIDGQRIAGRAIELSAEHLVQRVLDGNPVAVADARFDTTVVSTDSVVVWTFKPEAGGHWRLRALIRDSGGRENLTEVVRWIGRESLFRAFGEQALGRLVLTCDQSEYSPGDTARVHVSVPFAPSQLLVTLQRQGILETRRLSLTSSEVTLDIPIKEVYLPALHVHVEAVGSGPRNAEEGAARSRLREAPEAGGDTLPSGSQGGREPDLPLRPLTAQDDVSLEVTWSHRSLHVNVLPVREVWAPGDSGRVVARVRDHRGRPVPDAQILLYAVDETVLSLGRYHFRDPGTSFYRRLPSGVRSEHLRGTVLLWPAAAIDPSRYELQGSVLRAGPMYVRGGRSREQVFGVVDGIPAISSETTSSLDITAGAGMGLEVVGRSLRGDASEGRARILSPLAIRSDFGPLAFFEASLVTDDAGEARVDFLLPDNLTRYRVMAVATDGDQRFGAGDSTFTGRKRLMVRPSLPRFLYAGDRCELPVQLHNLTDASLAVRVAARSDHLTLTGPTGYQITIPPRDRVDVRFPVLANEIGEAAVEVTAASDTIAGEGALQDAARTLVPVCAPATTEAFATYGTIAEEPAVFYRTGVPENAFSTYGGLELSTSSTALQALTDGLLYLSRYRHRSSEHLASRVLAAAALGDVLTAFAAEDLPSPEELEQRVHQDIAELVSRCSRGAFGLWRPGQDEWPFVSVHATHALVMAQKHGFGVEELDLRPSLAYLKRIERVVPEIYPREVRSSLLAYALYVRHLAGDTDSFGAVRLLAEAGGIPHMPLEALGWILPVLHAGPLKTAALVGEIHQHLLNRSVESAATAQFVTRYEDGDHLIFHGRRRTDAVLLTGLMATDPSSDLIVKLVRGLLAHRTRGHWSTTQENAWVLVALGEYFRRYEAEEPDFVARSWLGNRLLAQTAFHGRQTERHHLAIPMSRLGDAAKDPSGLIDLVLEKSGSGRLYYRLGIRYAPRDPDPPEAQRGFTVTRTYRGMDRADDVWQDADGVIHVRAGARVEVDVTLVAPARRYHVVLIDPLPAGFEVQNPSLAGYGPLPGDRSARGWFRSRWFEHQNVRDEQTEAFASLLREGVHSYLYTVRATTPGRFIAPPPRAEEMYHPETFGRGSRDVIVVE